MLRFTHSDVEQLLALCKNEGLLYGVKALKEKTSCGLKEAKDVLEACREAGYSPEPLVRFVQDLGFYVKHGVSTIKLSFQSGGVAEYDFLTGCVNAQDMKREEVSIFLSLVPGIQELLKPLEK
jgi:hypothetical protein